jgi:hypothetical protein
MKRNIISDINEIQLFIYTKKQFTHVLTAKKGKWEILNLTDWIEAALLNFILVNLKFSLVTD